MAVGSTRMLVDDPPVLRSCTWNRVAVQEETPGFHVLCETSA